MKLLSAVLLLLVCPFVAVGQNAPYQDAVLKSFRMVSRGQTCHTNGSATSSPSGGDTQTTASANTTCSDTTTAYYTIEIGEQKLILEPTLSTKGKAGAVLSLGWSRMFAKNSCLYGQLPGAHIQIRSEEGVYRVKVGKRESLYKLVGAE